MKKYRIWEKDGVFKIARKKNLFSKWEWLDICKKWCNWYGEKNPCIFSSILQALEFIREDFGGWEKVTSKNIHDYLDEG